MKNTKEVNMNNTKNALAELAAEMKEGLIHLEVDTVPLWVEVYGKAQRIVEELAKVSNISQIPMPYWNCQELEALRNCRAIAEEGGVK